VLASLAALSLVSLPVSGRCDIVKLRDGSTLKGRVVSIVDDTLSVETGFGALLRVPRAAVILVSFTDSLPEKPTAPASVEPAPGSGTGRVAVTFVDDKVSSKIGVVRGRDRAARLRANSIELRLSADGRVVHTWVDSTMDKTIYNGPERVYKNTAELEDFEVELPAGLHHLELVVRNTGYEEYADAFDGDPLQMTLPLDNIQVVADRSVRIKVGISRGLLRMGEPHFHREE
jgi:hypothetical protein